MKNLEDLLIDELARYELISPPRTEIEFQPAERGTTYRRLRSHLLRNLARYVTVGAAGIGGTALLYPAAIPAIAYTSIGGGILGALYGMAKPFDSLFLANPKDFVPRLFQNIAAPWAQTYGSIEIHRRDQLENYVLAARNAHIIEEAFPDHTQVLQMGIMIGKIADTLSSVNFNGNKLKGLTQTDVIRMLRNQKLRTDEDDTVMRFFNTREITDQEIANLVAYLEADKELCIQLPYREPAQLVRQYLSSYEFRLAITGGEDLSSIASQISKGTLRVRTSLGHNGASYMGMHSTGKDFPRVHITDNVGSSFMTRARRGIGRVGGNAEHQVLAGATGGVAIVSGTAEHEFGKDMDDSTWPAIGICYGGMWQRPRDGGVKNGLIIAVNRDIHFRDLPPQVWRFTDGKREDIILGRRHREQLELDISRIAGRYILDWIGKHERAYSDGQSLKSI